MNDVTNKSYLSANVNNFNFKGFKMLLQASQDEIQGFSIRVLKELYGEQSVKPTGDAVLAIGTEKILLVSHMDVVNKMPKDIFYDKEQQIIWSPDGCGGDDRCGVWSILKIVKMLKCNNKPLPSILFTRDEEIGCVGAKAFTKDKTHMALLKNKVDFCIELDRQGKNDFKMYQCSNPDFKKFIEGYGYKMLTGSISDIYHLCPELGCSGANLSIGYYNEHTQREFIKINEMFDTLNNVFKIISDHSDNKVGLYKFTSSIPKTTYNNNQFYNNSKWNDSKYEEDGWYYYQNSRFTT